MSDSASKVALVAALTAERIRLRTAAEQERYLRSMYRAELANVAAAEKESSNARKDVDELESAIRNLGYTVPIDMTVGAESEQEH